MCWFGYLYSGVGASIGWFGYVLGSFRKEVPAKPQLSAPDDTVGVVENLNEAPSPDVAHAANLGTPR